MQPHISKHGSRSHKTAAVSAHRLNEHCAYLRELWDYSREESRRAVANAQKVRRESRELIKQWTEVVAQTRHLRLTSQNQKRTPLPVQRIGPPKQFVATARRVPWRRLQMEDMDGPMEIWIAPGYEQY